MDKHTKAALQREAIRTVTAEFIDEHRKEIVRRAEVRLRELLEKTAQISNAVRSGK